MDSLAWIIISSFISASLSVAAGIPGDILLPFGEAEGDTAMNPGDEGTTSRISLEEDVYFMGERVYKFFVNTNGVISIDEGFSTFYPRMFPFSTEEKAMIIAPFYADIDTGNDGGDIYYRVEKRNDDNDYIFRRLERLVYAGFFDLESVNSTDQFEGIQMFIVTWDRVSYYSDDPRGDNTNTFQMVLLSDEIETYVIFNYDEITWTTGISPFSGANIDGTGGNPGAMAKVGFNLGDGIHGYMVNASGTEDVIHMDTSSNTGLPGRWIFRVDGTTIEAPGENSETICYREWQFYELEYACYKFFDMDYDWEDARVECEEAGDSTSHLATITNQEKNDFIAGSITGGVKTWVGGNFNETDWSWITGEPWLYESWRIGKRVQEPNNWGGKENCLTTNFVRPGLWNDHFCQNKKPFICEMTPIMREIRGGGEGS